MTERTTKQIGDRGEAYAEDYLKKRGYIILDRNYRKRCGEIDIIAQTGNTIAFVEVKTRHTNSLTQPYEALDRRKRQRILQTARTYLYENAMECFVRFDLCEVFVDKSTLRLDRIRYYEGAFDGSTDS